MLRLLATLAIACVIVCGAGSARALGHPRIEAGDGLRHHAGLYSVTEPCPLNNLSHSKSGNPCGVSGFAEQIGLRGYAAVGFGWTNLVSERQVEPIDIQTALAVHIYPISSLGGFPQIKGVNTVGGKTPPRMVAVAETLFRKLLFILHLFADPNGLHDKTPDIERWENTRVSHFGANADFDENAVGIIVADDFNLGVFDGKPWPATFEGNLVGSASFSKGSPDKRNAYDTEAHADDGCGPHDKGPIGGLPLRYKVALLAPILAVFVALFLNAIRLVYAGKGGAILPYLLLGVSGIFATLIIGLPLIYGVTG